MPETSPDQRPGPSSPGQAASACAPGRSCGSRLVVAAAVLDSLRSPAEVLCAARSYPPGLAGRFELPGGKVEPGETPTQALVRELAEEVSLTVRLGPELAPAAGVGEAAAPRGRAWRVSGGLSMRVWLAEPERPGDRGRLGADHQELRWVRLGEVAVLPWLDADVPIIEALLTRLEAA